MRVSAPYKIASREFHDGITMVTLNGMELDPSNLCSRRRFVRAVQNNC